MSALQDLYDSELNFTVSTLWDGGFQVKLGDEMNGFVAEATFWHWGQVEQWLVAEAINRWPESDFAKIYRDGANKRALIRARGAAT